MIKYFKNMPSLTKFIVFSFTVILIYTVAEFFTKTQHDTLTTCLYACFGGEVLSCALIKVFKLKEENKDEQQFFDGSTYDCIGFDIPDGGSSEEDFE